MIASISSFIGTIIVWAIVIPIGIWIAQMILGVAIAILVGVCVFIGKLWDAVFGDAQDRDIE